VLGQACFPYAPVKVLGRYLQGLSPMQVKCLMLSMQKEVQGRHIEVGILLTLYNFHTYEIDLWHHFFKKFLKFSLLQADQQSFAEPIRPNQKIAGIDAMPLYLKRTP